MNESINTGGEGLDGLQARQDISKVTEQDVKRVQEQGKKAQQAKQDIKKDKDTNAKLAKFVSFLLKNINNENFIKLLYDTFFKVFDKEHNTTYLRKTTNSKILAGIFAPFYREKIKEFGLEELYGDIIPSQLKTTEQFIQYLKKLSSLYHDNIPIDKELLSSFLTELVVGYLPVHQEKSIKDRKQAVKLEIMHHLYSKQD